MFFDQNGGGNSPRSINKLIRQIFKAKSLLLWVDYRLNVLMPWSVGQSKQPIMVENLVDHLQCEPKCPRDMSDLFTVTTDPSREKQNTSDIAIHTREIDIFFSLFAQIIGVEVQFKLGRDDRVCTQRQCRDRIVRAWAAHESRGEFYCVCLRG